ncbi:MAG TPA: DNA-directed RNA polymerase subunit alpha C-terminal domain-containing protein, partial [Ktedonobacterales bacterium]|nr:DNA-directed RNA polymerase subunit alpha C-terminal domain-containing protein [Ktedonobacterales bacterium]
MLDVYIRAFSHLHPSRAPFHWTAARKNAPFKALLLLAVSDLVGEGVIENNFIVPDATVVGRFGRYWTILTAMQARQANLELAFLGLADDGFWHLEGKPRLLGGARSAPAGTFRPQHLQDVTGASFDAALFDFLCQNSSRYVLQKTLTDTYISPDQQERLSIVRRTLMPQAGELMGNAESNGPHMLASGETSTGHLGNIGDDVAQRAVDVHDDRSESQWDNYPSGTFPEQTSDDAGSAVGMVHYDVDSVSVLSAVFLHPEALKQAVFAHSLATTSDVEMRTPAGTRQIALGWNTLEHMPLIAGHLRETLNASGYDLGADWSLTLGLSVRVANVLRRHSIRTMGELARWTLEDLLVLRNFGVGSLGEVISALRAELWPHLSGCTLDELVPSHPPEKSVSTASDLGGGTVPVGDPPAVGADVNLTPRGRPANSLFASDELVLPAPQAYGPLLSHAVLAGLRAVGCDVVRIVVRGVLLGGPGDEQDGGRVRVHTANVLAREGLETLVDVVL